MRRYRISGIVLSFALMGLSVLAVGLFMQQKASAIANYTGYFNGVFTKNGGYGTFVDCSNNPGACTNYASFSCNASCTSSPDTSKSRFISDVLKSPAKAFYINVMAGGKCGPKDSTPSSAMVTCWENLVNDPGISIAVATKSTSTNSYYDTSINDWAFSTEPTSFPSLVFYKTGSPGTQYTIIKIICGNLLNDVALPVTDSVPTGSISLSCNPDGTGKVDIKFSDADGSTSAKLTINYAGSAPNGVFNYGSSGTYTRTVTAPDANGPWSASLLVYDKGGSSNITVNDSSPTCNKPPTGSFLSVTCSSAAEEYVISGKWGDPNGATEAVVEGATGTVPVSTSGTSNPSSKGSTSGTWHIATTNIPSNEWPIRLKVRDSDGGALLGWVTVDTATKPNCIPVGTIADYNGTCTTVTFKLWDPNEPTNSINYYLAVNGGAKQKGPTPFGGQSAANRTQNVTAYPGFDYWKANNVVLWGVDVDTGVQYNVANVTLPVCGKVSCGTSSIPGNLVAGVPQSFDVTVTITGPAGTPGPSGAKFTAIKIGSQTTSSAYTPANPAPAGGLLTSTSQSYTPPGSGTITGSWTFGGGESNPSSITCPLNRSVTVVYEPYFTVLGGDTSAGQGFGGSCTDDDTTADIEGYNADNGGASPNYFGASSRDAAIATGAISQFATDLTNNVQTGTATNSVGGSTDGLTAITDNSPPSGLAFANFGATGTTYGGQYLHNEPSTFKWCVPDYVSSAPAPTNGTFNPTSIPTAAGTYVYTYSGGTFPAAMHLNPGVNITVESTGSVYINGDIMFDGGGGYNGSPTSIPQFNLLVKGGNIYVGGGVQELHGFYAAEPGGANTGIIYTCATGVNAPSVDYNTCNNPLTFYGSVAGHEIVPGRTYGNIGKAADSGSDKPAEQFVYTPEMWLSGASGPTTSCAADPTQTSCLYQSFTSLPPVL